jgi:hypothetical protein
MDLGRASETLALQSETVSFSRGGIDILLWTEAVNVAPEWLESPEPQGLYISRLRV